MTEKTLPPFATDSEITVATLERWRSQFDLRNYLFPDEWKQVMTLAIYAVEHQSLRKKIDDQLSGTPRSETAPITDERIEKAITFLKYWNGNNDFWPLVKEQLQMIAKEAASAPSATRPNVDPQWVAWAAEIWVQTGHPSAAHLHHALKNNAAAPKPSDADFDKPFGAAYTP